MSRWRCRKCNWLGTEGDCLEAPHPFQGNGNSGGPQIYGCPNCKEANQFVMTCDEVMNTPPDYYPVGNGWVLDPKKAKMWNTIRKWRAHGPLVGTSEAKLDALYEIVLNFMEASL